MNIVVSIDHKFVMPCGVLFHSICVNNKDCNIRFFIITDSSFTEEDNELLKGTVTKFNSANQLDCFYVDPDEIRRKVKHKEGVKYKIHVLYRLFLASLLPNDIDKVLFLDGDIIVRQSLDE